MSPELRSFFLLGGPLPLVLALFHYGFWLYNRRQRAFLHWGASNLIGGIALLLWVLHNWLPWWAWGPLSSSLVIASALFAWSGMNRFAGQDLRLRLFAAVALAYLTLLACVVLFGNEMRLRMALLSSVLSFTNLGAAFDMLRAQRQRRLVMRSALIAIFTLHGLHYLARAVWALTLDSGSDLPQTAGVNDFTTMVSIVKATLWSLGALLMDREARYEDEHSGMARPANISASESNGRH